MTFTQLKRTLLVVSSIFVISACGGSDTTEAPPVTPPANIAPTANAGPDQAIESPTVVTLSGVGADSDGAVSTYSWAQTSGETVSLNDASLSIATFESPAILSADTLVFTLTVTDDDGAVAEDTVSIAIAPVALINEIIFSDANLAACVTQKALDTDVEFTYELTSLLCNGLMIMELDGIEKLTALTELGIYNNQITNLNALSNLTTLKYLYLWSNQITDISGLSNLTALTTLYLDFNQIADISALSNLTGLTKLYVNNNQITDIIALSSLTALTDLYLYGNQITGISALSSLTALTTLYLNDNKIADISSLSSLTALTTLYLTNNQITGISALFNLIALTDLLLGGNNNISCTAVDDLILALPDTFIPQPAQCR